MLFPWHPSGVGFNFPFHLLNRKISKTKHVCLVLISLISNNSAAFRVSEWANPFFPSLKPNGEKREKGRVEDETRRKEERKKKRRIGNGGGARNDSFSAGHLLSEEEERMLFIHNIYFFAR